MAMLRGMQRFAEGERARADFCDAVATLAVDDDAETEPTHDVFIHRRQQTIDEALWSLRVNLGHASLATMLRHLKHANATPAAMERANKFERSQCDSKSKPVPTRKTAPDIDQPPLKSIGMDVTELPRWQPHQRVKP